MSVARTKSMAVKATGGGGAEVVRAKSGRETVNDWLASRGWRAWPFQQEAWDAYAAGRSGLIQVATGAGKTYGAYLGPLAELIDEVNEVGKCADEAGAGGRAQHGQKPSVLPERPRPRSQRFPVEGLRVLYITPLRAVSRDIELALKAPVMELGLKISIESRTGDTSASVRARQRDRLPNVLITTPESLSLILTRENAAEQLSGVRAVIVDEWHELMTGKRGTQTELGLARVREFAPKVRTWAMSATLGNLEEAAQTAVGTGCEAAVVRGKMDRPVIVDSVLPRDLKRLPWAGHMGLVMLPEVLETLDPAVSTLLFTNTRSQAERWYHAIAWAKPEWAEVMALHHGSIDRDERERVEGGLKSGAIRICVATSSLDLGVDFSPVERVFQIGSPKGIARVAQRAGRSSHRPFAPCRITCVPTHALELFEVAAARRALDAGEIEPRLPLSKPLDVLAQHLVTCGLGGGFHPDAMYEEVKRAWSYRDLTRQEFEWALALVREGGGTLAAYPDYHRVALGEDGRYRVVKPRIAQLHRLNVGTITGDATMDIRMVRGRSLGRIEENFVSQLREGQQFVFAGRVLQFAFIQELTAYVRPGKGKVSLTPIWDGTKLPISESLSDAIRMELERAAKGDFDNVELAAAKPLAEVQRALSHIPAHDEVLIEINKTREGTHLFLFPFEGRQVSGGLAAILALRLSRLRKASFSIAVNDYGLEILCAEAFPYRELLTPGLFSRERLVEDTIESVNITQLAKRQFRDVARVAGLVFQSYPGMKKSGRQFHASSSLLFDVLNDFDPGNLLLHQARREVMERHFEESRLARTLERIGSSKLMIVEPERLTPLSFPLLMERQAAKLTSESVLERVQKMRKLWSEWE